jgi:hypothetical protein
MFNFFSQRNALNVMGQLILHAFTERPKQNASRAGGKRKYGKPPHRWTTRAAPPRSLVHQ